MKGDELAVPEPDRIEEDSPSGLKGAYEPAPAEKKLWNLMCDPEYFRATETEFAQAAGLTEKTVHKIFAKPEFWRWIAERRLVWVLARMDRVLAMSADAATDPRYGFKDREMLLQVGGVYTPKQQVQGTGPSGSIQVIFKKPEGQR